MWTAHWWRIGVISPGCVQLISRSRARDAHLFVHRPALGSDATLPGRVRNAHTTVVLNGALVPPLDGGDPLVCHILHPTAVEMLRRGPASRDYLELHTQATFMLKIGD